MPAARAAASVYDGDVLDHMQAAAKITLPAAADLAGVVVTASTDLPVGAGVPSSASLTLAVVAALAALQHGDAPGTADACALARQAEAGELGTGAGWMDFLACASGGVNQVSAGSPAARRPDHRLAGPAGRADRHPAAPRHRHSAPANLTCGYTYVDPKGGPFWADAHRLSCARFTRTASASMGAPGVMG